MERGNAQSTTEAKRAGDGISRADLGQRPPAMLSFESALNRVSAQRSSTHDKSSDISSSVDSVSGYVVSLSGKHALRRLHLAGACHRVLGADYVNFSRKGDSLPDPSEYDDYCHQCLREGPAVQCEGDDSMASDDEPSSTSAETSEYDDCRNIHWLMVK